MSLGRISTSSGATGRACRSDVYRRELLRMAVAAPLLSLTQRAGLLKRPGPFTPERLRRAPWRIIGGSNTAGSFGIEISRTFQNGVCRIELTNVSRQPVRLKEVVLFDVPHDLPPGTPFYGEGFQMLSQTGGTLGKLVDLGNYTDFDHYKLPEPEGARTVCGVALFGDTGLAFGSCRRFNGKFNIRPTSVEVVVDLDDLAIAPRERIELEEVVVLDGTNREALLAQVGDRLAHNHPPLRFPAAPSGWCSWYCFGPNVTAKQVLDNLDFIAKEIPGLKYIQIDDGYQPAMGDWLETGKAFGGNVQDVLKQIRARGFEPAIWVAPFIAEKDSRLFREHPDWFVQDSDGTPLRADKVTFGGWRRGPWYALDGTHPDAQKHLTHVFETMRRDWGCTYFKLDANFWGAIHGGRFHDPRATRVEAYRRGMEAVLRGAGDAFILGCNHPIWASAGLIHGSRSSNDIKRTWERIATTGRQNLYRNWQNGRLWWNDPDAVVLTGELPDNEFTFHASVIYATGGMVLSGDDLTTISKERLAMLRKLQPPTGVAARFEDASLRAGTIDLQRQRIACFFNWSDAPDTIAVQVEGACQLRDFWTDEDRGRHAGGRLSLTLPARTARLIICDL